jgi:uncharacterized protein
LLFFPFIVLMHIIDAHAHIICEENYVPAVIETMNELGISKMCISGLGKRFNYVTNREIRRIFTNYPDQFIGAYFIQPGVSNSQEIHEAHAQGFRMLKVTLPQEGYDSEYYYDYWDIAQDLGLPILFHTGIVTIPGAKPEDHISSWNMHPMRLEPIANAFPRLNLIIAHLGIHWNADAAEVLRMKPNVYADITGEPSGWRLRMDQIGLDHWLWWEGAFEKILFGTDVHYSKIKTILNEDVARYEKLTIAPSTQEKIFAGNISKLLGEKP